MLLELPLQVKPKMQHAPISKYWNIDNLYLNLYNNNTCIMKPFKNFNINSKICTWNVYNRAFYIDGKLKAPRPGMSPEPRPCAGNKGTQITVNIIFRISINNPIYYVI